MLSLASSIITKKDLHLMLMTWLPLPSYRDSADALSDYDLKMQRVHVVVLLEKLHQIENSEIPLEYLLEASDRDDLEKLVAMWSGHEAQLCEYGAVICEEWLTRIYTLTPTETDPVLDTIIKHLDWAMDETTNLAKPEWFGNIEFHHGHQAALVRRDADHYRSQFLVELHTPLVWPGV